MTVCQVRTAISAVIRACVEKLREAANKVSTHVATQLAYYQRRNPQARESHTKRTIRELQQAGIQLSELKTCQWSGT